MGVSGSGVLSDGWRSGIDWNVESVRGAGRGGLGAAGETAENDFGAVGGVRADCACVRRTRNGEEDVGKRGDLRGGIASAEALWGLHHAGDSERVGRSGFGFFGRGDFGVAEGLGAE